MPHLDTFVTAGSTPYSAYLHTRIQEAVQRAWALLPKTRVDIPLEPGLANQSAHEVIRMMEALGYNVSPGCCEPDADKIDMKDKQVEGRYPDCHVEVSETPPLKVGDVVRLKSGGPKMTIYRIGESDPFAAYCEWHDEATSDLRDCLPNISSLEKVIDCNVYPSTSPISYADLLNKERTDGDGPAKDKS